MRNRVTAPTLAFKILLLTVWLIGGAECISPGGALASGESKPPEAAASKGSGMNLEDEKGLLASIKRRQKELDDREEELKAREERLEIVKKDIDARIRELEKVRSEIEAFAGKLDAADNDSVKRLVKIYETMNPEEAAPRLEKLDTKLAVQILSTMREKNAARILEFVKVERSVALSQLLKFKKD